MSAIQQHDRSGVHRPRLKRVRAHFRRAMGIPKRWASYDGRVPSDSMNGESKQGIESIVAVSELTCPTPLDSTPSVQRALVVAQTGVYELRDTHAVPELENDTEVLIQARAVGLNPIDWKSVAYNFCLPSFPWITGREMAGVVERVGSQVSHVKPGDRVWTSTYYRDVRAGCFQEYIVVPRHTVLPIPADLSFEEAACLGVAALTASMALWKWLSVPMPKVKAWNRGSGRQNPQHSSGDSGYQSSLSRSSLLDGTQVPEEAAQEEWILIWGGSTVTGQFATQIARLAGLKPITVCSSRTAKLSEERGAEHVVIRDDREPSALVEEISRVTKGRITRALDLVGPSTARLCLHACSTPSQRETFGDRKILFAPLAMMKDTDEVPDNVTVEVVEMKHFVLDSESALYGQTLNDLIENKMLQLPPLEILDGGLDAVEAGLEMVRQGDRGGRKVVITVQ
ncbi:oxidoreductase, zinc-binding dehydrogenase family [Cladophialophora carrionii]|uniref:Oxidoreductase, zinc-binding dehydrogenase family n=1 Tax=Cladophialophora carrionii TaxID=86049 RepID=A0A1C1C687_9EURO|nr:oxidoreductase, zinc-binding dehydrogenase family [Cladophialophora carrionii]